MAPTGKPRQAAADQKAESTAAIPSGAVANAKDGEDLAAPLGASCKVSTSSKPRRNGKGRRASKPSPQSVAVIESAATARGPAQGHDAPLLVGHLVGDDHSPGRKSRPLTQRCW